MTKSRQQQVREFIAELSVEDLLTTNANELMELSGIECDRSIFNRELRAARQSAGIKTKDSPSVGHSSKNEGNEPTKQYIEFSVPEEGIIARVVVDGFVIATLDIGKNGVAIKPPSTRKHRATTSWETLFALSSVVSSLKPKS